MDYASMGKLYIVSTPIGNLGDMTARSMQVFENVDLILSEDTRETDKLLKNIGVEKPQIPYTDQKHKDSFSHILNELRTGKDIALVSDSGTPLISDPGFKLVRDLVNEGIEVVSIPGPSSVIAALTVSGLPTDKFIFVGFLPKSSKKRKELIKEYGSHDASLIIFESPKKVSDLLKETLEVLGNRQVSLVKDITKKFEKIMRGNIKQILKQDIKEKGEYVLIIAKEGFKLDG